MNHHPATSIAFHIKLLKIVPVRPLGLEEGKRRILLKEIVMSQCGVAGEPSLSAQIRYEGGVDFWLSIVLKTTFVLLLNSPLFIITYFPL
jgi:hypothetical protein